MAEEAVGKSEKVFKKLRVYNFVVSIVLLAQAVLMLFLSSDYTTPITTSYLTTIPESQRAVTLTRTIADVRLGPLVALFLFISFLALFRLRFPGYLNGTLRT